MTTRSPSPPLKQLTLGDLQHELATTRRVLERVPDEHLSWKPHPKSWSLGALASHLANLLFWQTTMLQHDGFDLASAPPPLSAEPASRSAYTCACWTCRCHPSTDPPRTRAGSERPGSASGGR